MLYFYSVIAACITWSLVTIWRSIWDVSFSTYIVLNLSSWSALRSTFTFLFSAVFSLGWVVIFFGHRNWTTDVECSLCTLNILSLLITTALSFTDFSLISNSVFIRDNNVLSSNLSLRTSRFRSKLCKFTVSLRSGKDGILSTNSKLCVINTSRCTNWGTWTSAVRKSCSSSRSKKESKKFHSRIKMSMT